MTSELMHDPSVRPEPRRAPAATPHRAPPAGPRRAQSEVTARAVAFVADHRSAAEAVGRDLADLVGDPETFARELRQGLERLADPEYLRGQQLVAPGIGPVLGVRWPLNAAVARGFRRATRQDSPTQLLFVADRLLRHDLLELRWFAFGVLERTLPREPERTWQLLRRAAREAGDWITVDTLAHPYGRGVLLEAFRWAEIGQLVFSPSRWERRLVASTIATIPHVDRTAGRAPEVPARALPILAQLIGDAEPDVQKALAWAYRTMAQLDPAAVTTALTREAELAAASSDGHRAWVIRDTLPKLDASTADALRERLTGIRRVAGAPPTSAASAMASQFADMALGGPMPEPPL